MGSAEKALWKTADWNSRHVIMPLGFPGREELKALVASFALIVGFKKIFQKPNEQCWI